MNIQGGRTSRERLMMESRLSGRQQKTRKRKKELLIIIAKSNQKGLTRMHTKIKQTLRGKGMMKMNIQKKKQANLMKDHQMEKRRRFQGKLRNQMSSSATNR